MSAQNGIWELAPFADAAGEATFYGGLDKGGREEGQRDRQIDLSDAALLADADFLHCGYSTGDHLVEPLAAFGDSAHQACASRELLRFDIRDALWGSGIRRDLLDGGLCQGILSDRSSERSGSSSV
jgi:hypothetical protein